jgi:hypothetical protein
MIERSITIRRRKEKVFKKASALNEPTNATACSGFFFFLLLLFLWELKQCRRMFRIFQTVTCQNCESPIFFLPLLKSIKTNENPPAFLAIPTFFAHLVQPFF